MAIRFRVKTQDDQFFRELKGEVGEYLKRQPNGAYGNYIMLWKAAVFLPIFLGDLMPMLHIICFPILAISITRLYLK